MKCHTVSVGSVHLSESDLKKLEELFRDIARDPDLKIQIKSNGFLVSESSVDDLRLNSMCQKESLGYDIHLSTDEGEIRLVADSSQEDKHELYVQGYSEWKVYAKEQLLSFMKDRRIRWRSRIRQREIMLIEVGSAIILSVYLTYLLPGRIIHYIPAFTDPFIISLSLFVLLAATKRNWVYPYVAVSLDGDTKYPQMKKITLPVIITLIFTLSYTLGFYL